MVQRINACEMEGDQRRPAGLYKAHCTRSPASHSHSPPLLGRETLHDGCCSYASARRLPAPLPAGGGGCPGGVGGAGLLRLRRLPRGQRQQQLPADHGARRRAALRHRLPHAPGHWPLLQRPQHPRHHQRAPRGGACAAVPEPGAPRGEAARRRQLRVGGRWDPQRHRNTVCEHHQDRRPAAVLPGVPAEAERPHRRAAGDAAGEPGPGAHHAGRQRLRQQLLPGAHVRALAPVRAPGLRPLHRLRVQQDPLEAVRAGRASRDRDGDRAAGVRAGGAGDAQPERRVRGGADARRQPLQPADGGHGARPQPRHRRRRLHHRQHLPRQLRLPRKPAGLRVHERAGGVLRAGSLQRDRAVHGGVQRVRQPGRVRVLGRVPPHGEGQPHHRLPVHARRHGLHAPHEPQHHPRHGPGGPVESGVDHGQPAGHEFYSYVHCVMCHVPSTLAPCVLDDGSSVCQDSCLN